MAERDQHDKHKGKPLDDILHVPGVHSAGEQRQLGKQFTRLRVFRNISDPSPARGLFNHPRCFVKFDALEGLSQLRKWCT